MPEQYGCRRGDLMVTLGRKIFNQYVEQSEELKNIKSNMRELDDSEREILQKALSLFVSQPTQAVNKEANTARKILRIFTERDTMIITR